MGSMIPSSILVGDIVIEHWQQISLGSDAQFPRQQKQVHVSLERKTDKICIQQYIEIIMKTFFPIGENVVFIIWNDLRSCLQQGEGTSLRLQEDLFS